MPFKVIAYGVVLAMVLGAAWTAYNKIWTSGYNQAQLELQDENIKVANAAVAEARRQWDAAAAAAATQLVVEENITESIRDVEKKIPVVVEGVDPQCRDLGPAVLGLFNEAVNAANNQSEAPPASP